jgi:uncharacterized protein (TIGR02145 family)
MKTKTGLSLLLSMGVLLIVTTECKKDDNDDPINTGNTIQDADGNVYHTVTIGSQVWMTENLKTTKYNDGTAIPLVTDDTAWAGLTTPGYCWSDNNEDYKSTYGALYNWYTINTGKLCPVGWHVPSDEEWTTLIDYLGGEYVALGKLKESGTTHWNSPNNDATNESGFTALPGGKRGFIPYGISLMVGGYGVWWSSTSFNTNSAWHRYIGYDLDHVVSDTYYKKDGLSVRCLRD